MKLLSNQWTRWNPEMWLLARESRGMDREELANAAKVTISEVIRLEVDRHTPKGKEIIRPIGNIGFMRHPKPTKIEQRVMDALDYPPGFFSRDTPAMLENVWFCGEDGCHQR